MNDLSLCEYDVLNGGWLKRKARQLFSAGTGTSPLISSIATGDAKNFKLFDDQKISDSLNYTIA
jgi:hypothetical protein